MRVSFSSGSVSLLFVFAQDGDRNGWCYSWKPTAQWQQISTILECLSYRLTCGRYRSLKIVVGGAEGAGECRDWGRFSRMNICATDTLLNPCHVHGFIHDVFPFWTPADSFLDSWPRARKSVSYKVCHRSVTQDSSKNFSAGIILTVAK